MFFSFMGVTARGGALVNGAVLLREGLTDGCERSVACGRREQSSPGSTVSNAHHRPPSTLTHRTLGALAEKCHAYAKALHYKELEYNTSPSTAIEALISINNHLRQPDAAVGILTAAQKTKEMTLKESWWDTVQGGVGGLREGDKETVPADPDVGHWL